MVFGPSRCFPLWEFYAFPEWIKGGFVGVAFFVISGFLISRIIFGSLEQGRFSYVDRAVQSHRLNLPNRLP